MTLFSQRMGITPLEKAIQLESMDDELRYGLWNVLQVCFWDPNDYEISHQLDDVAKKIWFSFFKLPIDTCPPFFSKEMFGQLDNKCAYATCRKYFLEGKTKWWQIYDFVEFIFNEFELSEDTRANAVDFLNHMLVRENAAYRYVGSQLVAISDKNEIDAIESALEKSDNAVTSHLQGALSLLADRKSPDYRNSIKESISAVESLCGMLAGSNTRKFSDSLAELEKMCSFHPALKRAFLQLYGYTSDSGGIRHALTADSEHPSYADAKFMLVTCSAFCNFLQAKISEMPQ
ncbi:AbiJ-NTD4 domain-containing protein [Erwinia pyrifoliae]|uniref:AbiJ-NTD4 domain-containing protein n=1 Tax=Erwinia pyrifoliae TaxID=79967 RepID=UPI00223B3EC4|nr:hypothetical protein [Erwinia pyrifoliae]MCT2386792.1 hypothetical protein [Erwinia pyrifoliae]MCU8587610.1 hypothetical protein [Erwinia pyrifoliae]